MLEELLKTSAAILCISESEFLFGVSPDVIVLSVLSSIVYFSLQGRARHCRGQHGTVLERRAALLGNACREEGGRVGGRRAGGWARGWAGGWREGGGKVGGRVRRRVDRRVGGRRESGQEGGRERGRERG